MGDLISRSALIKMLETYKFGCLTNEVERDYIKETMIEFVKTEPTAYNVENVVEEIEEHRANFDCRICKYNKTEGQVCLKDCTDALIDGLFDIVKRGGVND